MSDSIALMAQAIRVGYRDMRVMFTWRTWILGWFTRVVAQVSFFGLLGLLIGDPELVQYLIVGNAVMLAAMTAIGVSTTATWERRAGTLPILLASPSSHVVVFVSRSAVSLANGVITSLSAFLVTALMFDITLPMPRSLWIVALVPLVSFAAYCCGAFLGAFVLRVMEARNVITNIAIFLLMTVTGVNVPVDSLPGPVAAVANILPVTHGLAAIRGVIDGAPPSTVISQGLLEAVVGLGWLAVTIPAMWWFAERLRRNGQVEFGDV